MKQTQLFLAGAVLLALASACGDYLPREYRQPSLPTPTRRLSTPAFQGHGPIPPSPMPPPTPRVKVKMWEGVLLDPPLPLGWIPALFNELIYVSGDFYPLNSRTLFLAGQYMVLGEDDLIQSRSLLLRSGDGGHYWEEVMQPHLDCEVSRVQFADDTIGWAVVQPTRGNMGVWHLTHTRDGGRSWTTVRTFASTEGLQPECLHMLADGSGEIVVRQYREDAIPELCAIRTMDGGLTWSRPSCHGITACTQSQGPLSWNDPNGQMAADSSRWRSFYRDRYILLEKWDAGRGAWIKASRLETELWRGIGRQGDDLILLPVWQHD